jgi:CopG family transcriptional regulator, nickel-responsive regulator
MAIISASLPEEALEELDKTVSKGGYKSRSDALRSAISIISKDLGKTDDANGKIAGVLVLVHEEKHEHAFSKARHDFEDLIKTSIHNQLGEGKCLELFILEGSSQKVAQLMKDCRKSGRAQCLKLITT